MIRRFRQNWVDFCLHVVQFNVFAKLLFNVIYFSFWRISHLVFRPRDRAKFWGSPTYSSSTQLGAFIWRPLLPKKVLSDRGDIQGISAPSTNRKTVIFYKFYSWMLFIYLFICIKSIYLFVFCLSLYLPVSEDCIPIQPSPYIRLFLSLVCLFVYVLTVFF